MARDNSKPSRQNALSPRLLRRPDAAAYLGVSTASLDVLRVRGEIACVPVPATRGTGSLRTPLYDVVDLDLVIDKWKARQGGSR